MVDVEEPLSFQYLSCAMYEFTKFQVTRLPVLADCLILAGNIAGFAGDADAFRILLEYWCKVYKKVVYVPGPQEFAGAPMDLGMMVCESIKSISSNIQVASPGHGSVVFPKSKIRVIGALLWGLDPKMFVDRSICMTQKDAKKKNKMCLNDTQILHKQDEEWIRGELAKSILRKERTIVVTHGCPSFQLCGNKKHLYSLVDPVSADILENGPDYWIYGAPGDEPVAKLDGVEKTTFCVNNYNAREDTLRGEHIISFDQ